MLKISTKTLINPYKLIYLVSDKDYNGKNASFSTFVIFLMFQGVNRLINRSGAKNKAEIHKKCR